LFEAAAETLGPNADPDAAGEAGARRLFASNFEITGVHFLSGLGAGAGKGGFGLLT
jgi:hypothetical protein